MFKTKTDCIPVTVMLHAGHVTLYQLFCVYVMFRHSLCQSFHILAAQIDYGNH